MDKMHIFATRVPHNLDKRFLEKLYPFLPKEKAQKIKGFKSVPTAMRSAIGELLARYALCRIWNIDFQNQPFSVEKNGKPYLKAQGGIHFNLSHSGAWVTCALHSQPVGVDIERVHHVDIEAIAHRFFSPEEITYLKGHPLRDREDLFFTLWTMKESFLKLSGEGLSLPLKSFTICFTTSPIEAQHTVNGSTLAFLKPYCIDPSYKLAVCSRQVKFADEVMVLELRLDENPHSLMDLFLQPHG